MCKNSKKVRNLEKSIKSIGLRYINDEIPGITRKKRGKGFSYFDPKGKLIRNNNEISRIKNLVIPPAWLQVWICPLPEGHLQATGRDQKKRKQYKYHPLWIKQRNQSKFNDMINFGKVLPKIRKKVEKDFSSKDLTKRKVTATAIKLLDETLIRVGNQQYSKRNRSFGLTTLRDRHVEISGSKINLQFTGKSGKDRNLEISNTKLANVVKKCRDIPGYELFQYFDADGNKNNIDSGDVNEYLKNISGKYFTAKDFRTWGGTLLAISALIEIGDFDTETEAKRNITGMVERVSKVLGNRAATSRKYYIHPRIIELYENKKFFNSIEKYKFRESKSMSKEEKTLLKILS